MKTNRCTPMKGTIQYTCSVDWEDETGAAACRHFIHDVGKWSRCGHFAAGLCLCGRAQDDARRTVMALECAAPANDARMKWSGSR